MSYSDPDRETEILSAARIEAVLAAITAKDAALVDSLLDPMHPADIADLLEQLSTSQRAALLAIWHGGIDGEVLSEIGESIRDQVIEALPDAVVAEAVRELDTDDVVDILEDLDEPAQNKILEALEGADRIAVEQALAYPENSAGRLMQVEVVVGPEHWTVGEAWDWLRHAKDLPDQFYHMILVDPRMRPTGYVTLGRIMSAPIATKLRDISEDSFRTLKTTSPEADVAYIFNQYHLISCPVVDENGRLAGVVTIDDAMYILDEQLEEDMLRLAGVGDESSIQDGVWQTVKSRIPWLGVNLVTANISAFVISLFDGTIGALVALAALMPVIASMGGNAGTQSLTVAVRALAQRDLTQANALRVIGREVAVGAINGAVFAVLMGLVGAFILGMPMLGLVLAMAMVINLMVAALAGIMVPILLDRWGFDPALASGTFVTTMTDVVGFFAFLGLASVMLL